MITFILGRSGCGKTEYIMERLPRLAKECGQVWYLVPEQSSMALERRLGGMGLSNVKVVSFRRLCNEIFRRFGGVAGRYMTRTRETALIYRILEQERKNLVYYRSARSGMGFVARLADAFAEIARAGLSREAVMAALERSNRPDWQDKYRDIFRLYEAYTAALDAENRSAAEDIAVAAALAEERGFFENSAIVLDGFFGFTGRQRELLRVAFNQSGAVCCALLLDPADPALMFGPAKGELAALKRLAPQGSTEEIVIPGGSKRLLHADLRHLEQYLCAECKAPAVAGEHIRLLVGQNLREELAMVAVDIAKKVREQGFRYRDFALVAGNLSEYGPVAETVFAKYGVPLFVDRGRAALGKPLFAFVQSALRIISPERYFRKEDVLAFLKTGLCGEDADLISRLENYCTLWQVQGERFLREEDWTQNPAGLGKPDEESAALLQQLNGLRRRIRGPLLRFKERAAKGSGAALAEAVYGLLCDFNVEQHIAARAAEYQKTSAEAQNLWESHQSRRLSREYLKLYGLMTEILDDIYTVFGDQPLSIYALEELIGLCGEENDLSVPPPTMDAVTMGEVAHSRLEGVRTLYVVGAVQGLLPMTVSDHNLIGDRERQLFAAEALPCDATLQQENLQGRHRFYAALFSAREELVFSYSAFKMNGEPLIPSVYIERLKKLVRLTPCYRGDMELYDFAVTRAGARELTGWSPALREGILAELGEKPLPPQDPNDAIPAAVTRRIFGDKLRLSYSQISLYQNCPFHYFMEKTMDINPIEPITFDKANIGTFVHYGLERLVDRIIAENYDYDKYNRNEIQRFGEELAAEYLQDTLRDLNQTNRFHALYRRMTGLFCMVAENVVGELREGEYRPYRTEFGLSGVPLRLANGCSVDLVGSVDRVDTYEREGKTYLKVTDYKTGEAAFDLKAVTNRTGVQLPIYLYGLQRSGLWENPVPAVGCYMKAEFPAFEKPHPPEELAAAIQHYYRRGGLLTADRTALEGLDEGRGSHYFKIDYTKADNFDGRTTRVYEPETVEELVAHMETVVRQTAEAIYAGSAEVRPLKGKYHDACRFCDFSAVCGYREEHSEKRRWSEDPEGWREEE